MGAKKYSNETLDELVNIAVNQKIMKEEDIHNYANKLFDVVQISCWESIKNEVIQCEGLKNKSYESAMKTVNSMYEKIIADNEKFKSNKIETKLKAFRLASFLDVDPEKYSQHEEGIKSIIGKERINTAKELLLRVKEDDKMKDYALLTAPVRKRFEKVFNNEILNIRNIISKADIAQQQEIKDKKKFNIFKL